jgi:argininosuccinate synthase
VTGEVRLRLFPRALAVEGVRATHSLMRADVASYGERASLWTGAEAAAFAKIFGVPQMLATKARDE